jgi:hypothetical protein
MSLGHSITLLFTKALRGAILVIHARERDLHCRGDSWPSSISLRVAYFLPSVPEADLD